MTGPCVVGGRLFFNLLDGSTISCECIGEPYASQVVELFASEAPKCSALAKALRRAAQTEVNDDATVQGTELKARFIQRCNAMWAAADYLEDCEQSSQSKE